MAMWGLYGLPSEEAVRICIPKWAMLDWMDSIDFVSLWKDGIETYGCGNIEKSLADIVYVEGKKGGEIFSLTRADEHFSVKNSGSFHELDERANMTGYIKNFAWKYENEVRIKIQLDRAHEEEKICLYIPEHVIDSITVTTGPSFDINGNNDLYEFLLYDNRIKSSEFPNLVNYKKLCSMCIHKQFTKE